MNEEELLHAVQGRAAGEEGWGCVGGFDLPKEPETTQRQTHKAC